MIFITKAESKTGKWRSVLVTVSVFFFFIEVRTILQHQFYFCVFGCGLVCMKIPNGVI